MNELIDMSVNVYFEISNAEMFGGEGSLGYIKKAFEQVKNTSGFLNDSFVNEQIESTAKMFDVSKDDVRLISKEKYESETEEYDHDELYYNE